jgi:hypothetical protein
MLEFAKALYEAFGVNRPWSFVLVCGTTGFVVFGFVGWLIVTGAQRAIDPPAAMVAAHGRPPLQTIEPALDPTEQPKHRNPNSIQLLNGDLLVLRGTLGVAVVAVTHFSGCKAQYEWRFMNQTTAEESHGTGELFEQYAESPQQTQVATVVDVGGSLWIAAGPYSVQWSCGGSTSGWVYGRPGEVDALRMRSTRLADFRF